MRVHQHRVVEMRDEVFARRPFAESAAHPGMKGDLVGGKAPQVAPRITRRELPYAHSRCGQRNARFRGGNKLEQCQGCDERSDCEHRCRAKARVPVTHREEREDRDLGGGGEPEGPIEREETRGEASRSDGQRTEARGGARLRPQREEQEQRQHRDEKSRHGPHVAVAAEVVPRLARHEQGDPEAERDERSRDEHAAQPARAIPVASERVARRPGAERIEDLVAVLAQRHERAARENHGDARKNHPRRPAGDERELRHLAPAAGDEREQRGEPEGKRTQCHQVVERERGDEQARPCEGE